MQTLADTTGLRTLYQLSNQIRLTGQTMQRFRQFARMEGAFGPNMGNTYRFTKVSNLNARGRMIGELADIPEATDTKSYGDCTVAEYGLQIKWSWLASLLNQLSMEDLNVIQLRNDAASVLDELSAYPLVTGPVIYTPTGGYSSKDATLSTNGTAPALSTRPIQYWDVENIVDEMRGRFKVPGFGTQQAYIIMAGVQGTSGIKRDGNWIERSKYAQPDKLLTGEIGAIYNCRVVEETNVLRNMPGGGSEMVFMGDDAIMGLEVQPLELQVGFGGNFQYGRVKGLRWCWVGGFTCPWNYLTDSQTRHIVVSSNSLAARTPL